MQGLSIQITDLSMRYSSLLAIDSVSLRVEPGEFIAFLGPSGSGKSSVLMSVAGFTRPTSGSISIGERDITRTSPQDRNVGVVFQRYALFPHMTVAQNIAFPLRQRRLPDSEIRRLTGEISELVGLVGMEDRPVPNLSGGQQQRVALARALVYRPPVLLMDEPLGALDKKIRERLQIEIKQIQRATGTTVVFVTHDQAEAISMADRLCVLNGGRIEQLGTPRELYENPRTAFVADFIGEANVLAGAVAERSGPECRVRLSGGELVLGQAAGESLPAQGDAVELVVRPSAIRSVPAGEGSLRGRVVASSYLGEAVSLQVELADRRMLAIKENASSTWQPGDEVGLAWDGAKANVFKKT